MRHSLVPRPKSLNDTHLHLQLPGDWLDEAEALAVPLSEPGVSLTRADVLRKCIRRALDEFKAETSRRRR